jgi:hypothetical protein
MSLPCRVLFIEFFFKLLLLLDAAKIGIGKHTVFEEKGR